MQIAQALVGRCDVNATNRRVFSYGDAHRHRLGVNAHLIPVNAPRSPHMSYRRDGAMRTDGNLGATTTYHPIPRVSGRTSRTFPSRRCPVRGRRPLGTTRRPPPMKTPAQQHVLFENPARNLGDAPEHIKQRPISNCTRADPAYGAGVAEALGLKFAAAAE